MFPISLETKTDIPAAFHKVVNFSAFTITFICPIDSSIANVIAKSLFSRFACSAEAVETDTTLMTVPNSAMREGMKRILQEGVETTARRGIASVV